MAPGSASAPQLNPIRLKAAVDALTDLKGTFEAYQMQTDQRFKILHARNALLESKVAALQTQLQHAEELLGLETPPVEEDAAQRSSAEPGSGDAEEGGADNEFEDGNADTDAPVSLDDKKAIRASIEAMKSKGIRDVVKETFILLMGVSKLDGKSLPAYPHGISDQHELWPTCSRTKKKYIRFRWSAKLEDQRNIARLQDVFDSIRATGAKRVPGAAADLKCINDHDLHKKIKEKFLYMAREFLKAASQAAAREALVRATENGEEDAEDEDEEDMEDDVDEDEVGGEIRPRETRRVQLKAPRSKLTSSQRNSRAQSKLDARVRKRPGSDYTDAKFDSAFILNAMSEDEDDPDTDLTQAKLVLRRACGGDMRSA